MLSMTTRTLGLYAATLLVLFVATAELAPAQSKAGTTMNAVVSVSGMACQDMCAPALQRGLAKLPDVKAVTVSAEQGQRSSPSRCQRRSPTRRSSRRSPRRASLPPRSCGRRAVENKGLFETAINSLCGVSHSAGRRCACQLEVEGELV